jgi:hypothetical protein
MTGFMIFLAGEIQLDGAVELVYDKFRLDDDWHAEEALRALSRIASRRMLRLLRNAYRDQAWHVRNYSIGVLEAVHSPNAVQTLLALIDVEDDAFLRGQLGYARAQQLDADTADVARDLYWEAAEDPSIEEIRNALVALSYLDDYDLPERDEWEAKIVAGQLAFQEQCGIGGSKVRLPQA